MPKLVDEGEMGAKIIEKHFTLSREWSGPDQACSIEPDELRCMCNMRDEIEEILYGARGD